MLQTISKKNFLTAIVFFACLNLLSAQRPSFTSRIFYPVDAAATNFSLSSTPLSILADSGFIGVGLLNQSRFLSRFDKLGNLLWSRMHLNDSLISRSNYAKTADGFVFLGLYQTVAGSSLPRIFLSKLDINGSAIWSRVFSAPDLSVSTTISLGTNITVGKNGSILIAMNVGTNDVWQTFYILVNADGSLVKSWTFNELGRPNISPTLDGGFIIGSGLTLDGLQNGLMSNLRLVRLAANGDIMWTKYFSPKLSGTVIGSSQLRMTQMADSSFVLVNGATVTRLSSSGAIIWSKARTYQSTTGFVFSATTLVNSSMMVSANKIYTLTAAMETSTIGIGRETPIINELDAVTGEVRALGYPFMTGRFSSMLEVANNGGFWIMSDTIVPLGANMTRNVASRLMRTDAQFNAGCGAPLLVNTTTFDGNIMENTPPKTLLATSYNANMYVPTTATTFSPIVFGIKGECPTSLTGANDVVANVPISVYPNPTFGDFMIECAEADMLQVRVVDVAGRLVQTHKNVGRKHTLSMEVSGTYFLQIETAQGRVFKKVVKM